MNQIKRIMAVDPWEIKSDTLEVDHRRLQESLTAIGNGYMGMRGNFSETYSGDHHQGFYLAGVWYPDKTRVGWWKNGYPEYFGKAINALNIARIHLFIDGNEVDLADKHITDFSISLDMAKGILSYGYQIAGVGVSAERFFSVDTRELAVFAFRFENLDGRNHQIRIGSVIDADVKNEVIILKDAKHGFSNPLADERAKTNDVDLGYNPEAEKAGLSAMYALLKQQLGE